METVLFTDHDIVVFAITTSAIALLFSVLGLQQRITCGMRSGTNSEGRAN